MTPPITYLIFAFVLPFAYGLSYITQSHFPSDFGLYLINESENSSLKNEIQKVVSEKCAEEIDWFFENLRNFTDDGMWALRMVDATAKLPAGLLKLNLGGWMGNFDQCLEISSDKRGIKGNYCLGTMYIDIDKVFDHIISGPVTLRKVQLFTEKKFSFQNQFPVASYPSFGLCIPDGCTADDLQAVVQMLNLTFPLPFECQTADTANPPLTMKAWCVISFFALIILIMIASTMYDLHCQRSSVAPANAALTAFSVYTNGKKLLRVQKNPAELSCLNGIRVLSMVWVVAGHSLSVTATGPVSNALDVLTYFDTTQSMAFVSAVHSVDTFLTITGLLVTYTYMKSKEAGQKFNLLTFYVHRYIRLTPPFLAAMLVSMSLLQFLGSGPHWSFIVNYFQGFCEKSWWSSVIYLQNYINVKQWCIGQSWYLNIDWQLYLCAPLFLLTLSKKPAAGLSMLSIALVIFIAIPFYVTWTYELPALISNLYGDIDNFQNMYYLRTHTRASPWFVGALVGFVIAKIRFGSGKISIQKPLVLTMWFISLTVICVCVFMGHEELRSEKYSKYGNAFYNSLLRPTWALCIGWIVFACSSGHGGIINKFLSLPIFQVLNRFTYAVYLLHVTMLYMIIYASKTPVYFSFFHVAYSFWGIAMLSLTLSAFWVLAFESPVIVIENYFKRRHHHGGEPRKPMQRLQTST